MRQYFSTADFREHAKLRIPRAIFDYADGGAYDEKTLNANRAAFDHWQFRQKVMVDVAHRDLSTRLANQPAALPLAIAPTGLAGLFHAEGEIHGALAAHRIGVPYCLSTMSICSIETVRQATQQPFWFQQYLMKDRTFNQNLIARALAADCPVLVLTLDLQVQGLRRRDPRNGLTVPPKITAKNAWDLIKRPRWGLSMLTTSQRSFGNLAGQLGQGTGIRTLSEWIATQFDPSATWESVRWVRSQWPRTLLIKGVMEVEDAQSAVAAGADGIIVSNHGGRQLDGAPASLEALPEIVDAVGHQTEVWVDGGIQSGQDIAKALALGAKGVMIGKAYLYALAAAGQAGVERLLKLYADELSVTMALTGCRSLSEVNRSILRPHPLRPHP